MSKNKDQLTEKNLESDKSEINVDNLASDILKKLNLTDDEKVGKVLNEPTLDAVVNYIKSGKCKNIITMVGAGISTSAGIPDFRSPGSGLYDNLQKYNLPDPQAIFYLDYFLKNPKPFFALAKELYPGLFKPTKSHYFIKMLKNKGLLLRHYTQNIDTLERVAGLDEDVLVEAHGTFHTGHCLKCKKAYTQEWMKEIIFRDEIPKCESCCGIVKPDIVFFGENLPMKFFRNIREDFQNCDMLIIMGSSLVVHPFAGLVDSVADSCPRLLINREIAGDLLWEKPENIRDIIMLGDCDNQCQILADKLGWGEELRSIVSEEHAKLDITETKDV